MNSKISTPYLIGISGGSATGKTSVLHSLLTHFSPEQITLVSQDNYYHPREKQQLDANGWLNFDLPESIDRQTFFDDVVQLMRGKEVVKEEYTFNNPDKKSSLISMRPAPVIITEGLFVFHYEEIRNLLNYKVYIHADVDIRLERRIHRDHAERGYPKDHVLYQWDNHVRPADISYLEPYRSLCDLEIDNNFEFESGLAILKKHIENILEHA
ncbi:MAG: hypothetical protein RL226_521 [Bacteroidota bacterium]